MGVFGTVDGARICELTSYFLIGRSSQSALQLTHPSVSGQHACLRWTGTEWQLQDLGSRNGSYLDGRRLEPAERIPVTRGATLRFADDPVWWSLLDDDPPAEPPGAGRLPTTIDTSRRTVAGSRLEFSVSRNEEHVAIQLVCDGERTCLRPRAHSYLLLTLARARLADALRDPTASTSHGWVDQQELMRMLAVDSQALNLNVYRARKQLAEANVLDADDLIERRVDSKELRIGVSNLVIDTE